MIFIVIYHKNKIKKSLKYGKKIKHKNSIFPFFDINNKQLNINENSLAYKKIECNILKRKDTILYLFNRPYI